jgi:RNA polymerase-binding transcription factor DksA
MDLDHARDRITEEQDRVHGLIAGLRGELAPTDGSADSQDDHDQSPADGGTDTFEREKDLSILEELEAELAELEAALRRVDDGTYGVDEVTGAPIDADRLDALPAARTNVDPHASRSAGGEAP